MTDRMAPSTLLFTVRVGSQSCLKFPYSARFKGAYTALKTMKCGGGGGGGVEGGDQQCLLRIMRWYVSISAFCAFKLHRPLTSSSKLIKIK